MQLAKHTNTFPLLSLCLLLDILFFFPILAKALVAIIITLLLFYIDMQTFLERISTWYGKCFLFFGEQSCATLVKQPEDSKALSSL